MPPSLSRKLISFMESLGRADLSPATCRGYRYDLRHFLGWRATSQPEPLEVANLTEVDLVTYRQDMIAAGLRPATVNRRLEALRRLCRWAEEAHTLTGDITRDIRLVRMMRSRQPVGLTDTEVHALLRAAGASTMFDELKVMADRHAELHADRAQLQADAGRLTTELEQTRRP